MDTDNNYIWRPLTYQPAIVQSSYDDACVSTRIESSGNRTNSLRFGVKKMRVVIADGNHSKLHLTEGCSQ